MYAAHLHKRWRFQWAHCSHLCVCESCRLASYLGLFASLPRCDWVENRKNNDDGRNWLNCVKKQVFMLVWARGLFYDPNDNLYSGRMILCDAHKPCDHSDETTAQRPTLEAGQCIANAEYGHYRLLPCILELWFFHSLAQTLHGIWICKRLNTYSVI